MFFVHLFFNCKHKAAENTMTMTIVGASILIHAREPAVVLIFTLHCQYK